MLADGRVVGDIDEGDEDEVEGEEEVEEAEDVRLLLLW
jgi:hypothetical protein